MSNVKQSATITAGALVCFGNSLFLHKDLCRRKTSSIGDSSQRSSVHREPSTTASASSSRTVLIYSAEIDCHVSGRTDASKISISKGNHNHCSSSTLKQKDSNPSHLVVQKNFAKTMFYPIALTIRKVSSYADVHRSKILK